MFNCNLLLIFQYSLFDHFIQVITKCKQEGTRDNRYVYVTLDLGQEDASQRLVEVCLKEYIEWQLTFTENV